MMASSASVSGLLSLREIPSIATLYRTKELREAPTSTSTSTSSSPSSAPNQSFNDKISTIQHDITKLEVDAIVNAANRFLQGGGGVDGAIHRAAGPDLLRECATLGGCATGSAKITDAYRLPCKKVIHAVGPVYESKKTSEPLLRGCYRTALQLAVDNGCRTIAFSAISTGVYGYPSLDAAQAALDETRRFLEHESGDSSSSSSSSKIDKIVFCTFLDKDVDAYARFLPVTFPPTKEDLTSTSGSG